VGASTFYGLPNPSNWEPNGPAAFNLPKEESRAAWLRSMKSASEC
jgi:hypothetical protein